MKILALVTSTLRELLSKATLIILAGISTLIIAGVSLTLSVKETSEGVVLLVFGNPFSPVVPPAELSRLVGLLQTSLAGGLFSGVILFGVIATAGLVPDVLEKGTVDIYLSKPIARWQLLLGRYLGGVTAMAINIAYFIGAIFLVLGLKLGVWNVSFLLAGVAMIFIFSCLFCIVVFLGVLSRNAAISILGVYFYLFLIGPLLHGREHGLYSVSANEIYRHVVDGFYYLLPQIAAMQENAVKWIVGTAPDWAPFLQAALSSAAFFLGGALVLQRRDF
jgi:ABC-type transport system involved in multi-copper enzyme maturation permease subunit